MSKGVPKIKEWRVVTVQLNWLSPTTTGHGGRLRRTFIVLAPTRRLAVMNLRDFGCWDSIISCGPLRKPRGLRVQVTEVASEKDLDSLAETL
jgi:hypothetical protein